VLEWKRLLARAPQPGVAQTKMTAQ
jgi:hypothetical protein